MKNLLFLPLLLLLFGCASVTHNAMQKLKVETITADGQETTGAECTLTNNVATWFVRSGVEVQVHRSSQDLNVTCSSNGLPGAKGSLVSRPNIGMAGNIILGGAIGMLVDHNGGAGYTYPSWIKLVFGQTRVYDRKNEAEGLVLLGKQHPSLASQNDTVVVTEVTPNVVKPIDMPDTTSRPDALVAAHPARLSDAENIPYVGSNGRNAYREWIGKSAPKAFVVAPNGWYEWTQGTGTKDQTMPNDPSQRALRICERGARQPCSLYAVDDSIVWTGTAAVVR